MRIRLTSGGQPRRRKAPAGIAAVEMAVSLPLVLMLLIGTWEVGRIIEVQQFMNVAAREAARQAGSGLLTNAQVQQVALNCLKNSLGDTSGTKTANLTVTVTVYDSEAPDTPVNIDSSQAGALDLIVVKLSLPYQDIRWIDTYSITGATNLQAEVTWVSLKNFPFPTTAPQPPTG